MEATDPSLSQQGVFVQTSYPQTSLYGSTIVAPQPSAPFLNPPQHLPSFAYQPYRFPVTHATVSNGDQCDHQQHQIPVTSLQPASLVSVTPIQEQVLYHLPPPALSTKPTWYQTSFQSFVQGLSRILLQTGHEELFMQIQEEFLLALDKAGELIASESRPEAVKLEEEWILAEDELCPSPSQTVASEMKEGSVDDKDSSNRCCRVCSKVFETRREKRIHDLNVHSQKVSCFDCFARMPQGFPMIYHMKHRDRLCKRCCRCRMDFPNHESLSKHREEVHGGQTKESKRSRRSTAGVGEEERELKSDWMNQGQMEDRRKWTKGTTGASSEGWGRRRPCRICKHLLKHELLDEHYKEAHGLGDIPQCPSCSKMFPSRESLVRHIWAIHEPKVSCSVCDQKLPPGPKFEAHMKRHAGQDPVKCEKCDTMFPDLITLRRHKRKAHLPFPKIPCDICGRTVTSVLMKHHLQTTHAQEESTHPCPHCPKTFPGEKNLKQHVREVHQNQGLFVCQICGRGFSRPNVLKNHVETHGAADIQCEHCGKNFRSHRTLISHRREHHIHGRRYQCSECPKAYLNRKTLDEHMNTHRGIRPYVCSECGDTFAYSGAMFTHKKLKHKRMSSLVDERQNARQ